MACETCDHTMQRVNGGEPPVFWCPRCGTLKTKGGVPEFEVPKVIGRAHSLCASVTEPDEYLDVDALAMRVRAVRECFLTGGRAHAECEQRAPDAMDV